MFAQESHASSPAARQPPIKLAPTRSPRTRPTRSYSRLETRRSNRRTASNRRANHGQATKPPSPLFKLAKSTCSIASPPWQITRLQQIQGCPRRKLQTAHRSRLDPESETSSVGQARISPRPLLRHRPQMDRRSHSLGRRRCKAFKPSAARSPPARRSTTRSATATTTRSRRPFEPRLAAILATVAWNNVQNPTGKDKTKPRPPIFPS